MYGEKEEAYRLLYETASTEAGELSRFLSLFNKNIDLCISVVTSLND